jgi:peptidoglycan hydrolase-like protein with peptidoglycan-binding domain
VVVTPANPLLCTGAALAADTGLVTITGVQCNAGWAVGREGTCPATSDCDGVDVFHAADVGWVHDGYFPASCAEALASSGMSIYTAATFVPSYCAGDPGLTEVIRPESTGVRVVQLQTALIGLGYPIAADGRYGPRTQAAVRDFQARNGLEVDGIAGPQTQAALAIGPGGAPPAGEPAAPATTTSPPATLPPATAPPTTAGTTTTVAGPDSPVECSTAAISADVGRQVDAISACHSGWAIAPLPTCQAGLACPRVDVFHVTETGWVADGSSPAGCAEDLHDAGMSAYTAGDFASWCGVPNLPVERLVIEPGASGIVVTQLQIALVALGYPLAVDGTYGPGTEAAIHDFQERNGLAADGIAGPRTRELLGL